MVKTSKTRIAIAVAEELLQLQREVVAIAVAEHLLVRDVRNEMQQLRICNTTAFGIYNILRVRCFLLGGVGK